MIWLGLCIGGRGARAEPVRLQLKWQHQFQFAGYYAAIEKGYYREAGLEVTLVEAQPGRDPVEAVLTGQAEFGVGTSELLLLRGQKKPVVVLATIYQHSALVLLALHTKDVEDLQALARRPLMIEPQSAELFAYFRNEGVDPAKLDVRHHTFDVQALIDGKIAAMSAYVTDEPFELKSRGIDYLAFTPRAGGIDFYGDNLFTTEAELKTRPEQVRRFREASLRGWDYAMKHPQEIVALIRAKYGQRKSEASLLYEAEQTAQLIHPELIEVGHTNPGRWRHIADTYAEFGMLPRNYDLKGFLYDPDPKPDYAWVYWTLGAMAVAVAGAFGWILPLLRLNQHLRLAKEEAERADAAKSRYLAFITHEIRTPLGGLSGVVDLLKDEALTDGQREQIELIERSTESMLQLTNSVLDFSKMESGTLELVKTAISPAAVVRDCCELYRAAAHAKGLSLRYDIAADVPANVSCDPLRLKQIINNLLSNAVKFTREGGVAVTLTAEKITAARHGLTFRVSDTGPGISAAIQRTLFVPYMQGGNGVGRQYGGTGLGLAISRQLAHLFGGSIEVQSEPGKGATFVLKIEVELSAQGAKIGDGRSECGTI